MMLSRLVPAMHREMARALGDPHRMHATLMRAFDGVAADPRRAHGVLHRVDVAANGQVSILVQSHSTPTWSRLSADLFTDVSGPKDISDVIESLRIGDLLHFRVRANVTRKIDTKTRSDGGGRNGRRVPLRDDASRLAWLVRKGQRHGFDLVRDPFGELEVRITKDPLDRAIRAGKTLTFAGVRFDGRLRVSDPAAFRRAIENGVGPAKAYGFGLLSIARE